MHPLLEILTEGLEREERDSVVRRVELMNSELAYIQKSNSTHLNVARIHGWTQKKIHIVFCLNSFYQRIIAPLWSSAHSPSMFGSKIPIRYGKSIVFDAERNATINKMGTRFIRLCSVFQISKEMLEAQRASDLIWVIYKSSFNSNDEKKRE